MQLKIIIFCALFFICATLVESEFLYNRMPLKTEEIAAHGLKCSPGKTIIKITEYSFDDNDYDSAEDGRRTHTHSTTNDESCQICVCSVEGKDEYCTKRPAVNVNECMAIAQTKKLNNKPFDQHRSLSWRIRRDLIWHNDEIPYDGRAKCKRGTSYYTNSVNADDTDIDVPSDVESLLDYSNTSICSYCVCGVSGRNVNCIQRNPWFCEYFRRIREDDLSRDRYRITFQQDRPAYFRSISYRLRRTMDESMFDLIEDVGSKSNVSQQCIPFVSVYTDCSEGNRCGGCSKCNCTASGTWHCEKVRECRVGESRDDEDLDDDDVGVAFDRMKEEMELLQYEKEKKSTKFAPDPDNELLDLEEKTKTQDQQRDELMKEMKLLRLKRSVKNNDRYNRTVIFHNTLDEVNEDTLKNVNSSGTITAGKVEPVPQPSRRALPANSTSLHIEHTPLIFNPHAADNKVDTPAIHDDKEDLLVHHKVYQLVRNMSQTDKNTHLSKLIVNEMKPGTEIIGDDRETPVSNVTFTPENDTLTAVTFIAGNLLNKLWNMERDANENPMDTENIKHRTINNLLDLFKEPLNLRQEAFLKRALEQISTAMENKDADNISLCESVKNLKEETSRNESTDTKELMTPDQRVHLGNDTGIPSEALDKINNALDLMYKYERVQKQLNELKIQSEFRKREKPNGENLTKNEEETFNTFGKILSSLTDLLLPTKKGKKFNNRLSSKAMFSNTTHLDENLGNLNLNDLTISDKDRIVLDYLTHIRNSPKCLLNKYQGKSSGSPPSLEGNILLNLSEFFKIKSMSDLLKLAGTTKPPDLRERSETVETTTKQLETMAPTETQINEVNTAKADKYSQFKATKDKLIAHLKTILQDLKELQNINGKSGKNIELNDALPCIYNLIKSDKTQSDSETVKTIKDEINIDRLSEIHESLKKELKNPQTRRTSMDERPRPKSAAVWERTIKNLKGKVATRRGIDVEVPKSIEELIKLIGTLDNSGSQKYKSIAYLAGVPPAERLILLKTMQIDTFNYVSVLKEVIKYLSKMTTAPTHHYKIFEDFIESADQNMALNEKIMKNIDKPQQVEDKQVRFKKVQSLKGIDSEYNGQKSSNFIKLTREQILSQLIKNRIKKYLKIKENSLNGEKDINYDLAKRILLYLEWGNYNLAKDLYKVFISQNERPMNLVERISDPVTFKSVLTPKIARRLSQKVEPLLKFEDSKPEERTLSWSNQDQLIKQLLSMKQ